MPISPERYPLIVQVVDTGTRRPRLLVHSPDFGFSMGEEYEPLKVGQTELLIIRMREKIEERIKHGIRNHESLPSPTLPEHYGNTFESPTLLRISEAARLLKVSRQTLWRMAESGKIRTKETPGGHYRFYRSDIESLLQPSPPPDISV